MLQSTTMDREHCMQDRRVTDYLEPGEKVILSSKVLKFNHKNKRQQRIILVTDRNIYNVKPPYFMQTILAKLFSRIKRKIPYNRVYAITFSCTGKEFVIHVPTEYDYRFASFDYRDKIVQCICEQYCLQFPKMKFFFRDDIMLIEYTTTKVDAPKKVSRMPDNPELLNAEEFASGELRSPNIEQIFVQTKSTSTYNMFDKNELKKISMQDFNPITVLGRGAFGKVMLCEHKKTKTIFAIKSLNKENIIQKDQIEHTRTEKEILTQINHPFLVKLACAFQTPQKLFFVMPFVKGGELFHHLQSKRRFQEHEVKFFAAQLVQALGYLHSLGFAYRDIKPENILVGEDGYIKLTDFGLSKKLAPGQRTMTFVGTPDYMAPEILLNLGHNHMVDWWALGILIFELLIGLPPFYSKNGAQNPEFVFQAIKEKDIVFPVSIKISEPVKALIKQLCNRKPNLRLGAKDDADEIMLDPWFASIDLKQLLAKKIDAPFKPLIRNELDVNNFDEEFTNEQPIFSVVQGNQKLLEQHKRDFDGMSFTTDELS